MERFDLLVIGAGPGGYPLALMAARRGLRVAVVERDAVGGTCLNWGCIPTKALLASGQLLERIRKADQFGLSVEKAGFDWAKVQGRKDAIVGRLRIGIEQLFKRAGITLIAGEAVLGADRQVMVPGTGWIGQAERVVIATGSKAAMPGFVPADRQRVWSSDEALTTTAVPKSLLVVGGGVVGLEFGQVFASFGTEVTVVELMPQILPGLEPAIARRLLPVFKKSGLRIHCDTRLETLAVDNDQVVATFGGSEHRFERALVATGRRPVVPKTDAPGVELVLKSGAVEVDDRYQTSIGGVFAIGDCIPGPMLAHRATYDASILLEQWNGKTVAPSYRLMPSCVYTHPEIAWVGSLEEQEPDGKPRRVGRQQFAASGKAMCAGETEGQVKVVLDQGGRLLGAAIWGPEASNLITEAVVLGAAGIELPDGLLHAIHPHPTLSESLAEAIAAATGGGHG